MLIEGLLYPYTVGFRDTAQHRQSLCSVTWRPVQETLAILVSCILVAHLANEDTIFMKARYVCQRRTLFLLFPDGTTEHVSLKCHQCRLGRQFCNASILLHSRMSIAWRKLGTMKESIRNIPTKRTITSSFYVELGKRYNVDSLKFILHLFLCVCVCAQKLKKTFQEFFPSSIRSHGDQSRSWPNRLPTEPSHWPCL